MANSEEKKPNKKVLELLKKLNNEEPKEVIKAIKSLKVHGNESSIEPLVFLHSKTANNAIKGEIEDLLNTIKSTKVPPFVIKCLGNESYQNSHQALLCSIWSSNLDYTNYFTEIVDTAIKGGLMEAMECLTIIDNIDSTLSEEKILDAIVNLNSYLNDESGSEDPKYALLLDSARILQDINNSL